MIDAQRILLEFELSYQRTLANHAIWRAELERVVGKPYLEVDTTTDTARDAMRRHGLTLARSTMCGWMAASERLLLPLYDCMIERVLASKAIHTDGTPVAVQDKNRKKTRTGRLWVYRGDDEHPYCVHPMLKAAV